MPHDFTPSAVNDYSWYFQDPDALERARMAARAAAQGAVVARGRRPRPTTRARRASRSRRPSATRTPSTSCTASAIDVTRRFVTDEGRIPVVRRDHWAVVTTDKRVYRPKQEVRATIQTVDANQSPVSKAGDVLLVRVKRGPRPMPMPPKPGTPPPPNQEDAKRPRDARDGGGDRGPEACPSRPTRRAAPRCASSCPAPGTYRVRWNATDARGALVTAFATIDVSGEAEDLTKDARLVAAKETYIEGETAEVLLQSPVTKVKALLTFEGEKVLAYRLIDVDGPSTMLDVPVDGALRAQRDDEDRDPRRGRSCSRPTTRSSCSAT